MTLVREIDVALLRIDAETTGEVMRVLGDIERIAEEAGQMLASVDSDPNAEHASQLLREALDLVRDVRLGAMLDVPRQSARIRHALSE